MYAFATCRASIYRGQTTDEFGDRDNGGTVVAAGIAASIEEITSSVFDHATSTPRSVRTVAGLVSSRLDVHVDDRIHDDTNNVWFVVRNVTRPRTAGHTPDLELDLKRVN